MKTRVMILVISILIAAPEVGFATLLNLGPGELVQSGGGDIMVNGYSVPSYVDWDNDGRKDLIVGEGGGGGYVGRVRVYLNVGTSSNPQFSGYTLAQSNGSDLVYSYGCNCACLGLFPRMVYWDGDDRKDLITGTPDGTVILFLNIGTDSEPTFDGGTLLQVGPAEAKEDISVVMRATPTVVDWDNDGAKDLAIGALDGRIHLYMNEGTDVAPDFLVETFAQKEDGSDLVVPPPSPTWGRSSPVILDLDGDGNKDLLTGNTEGWLLFYRNMGTDASPLFSGYSLVESSGVAIDLEGAARSRPFVCDWTGDGYLDVLIGAGDGNVYLYQGVPEPATVLLLGLGTLALLRRRRA